MPKICYTPKTFSPEHEVIIARANIIIEDMRGQGFTLSLRQLYYQFVSETWLENTVQSYKRLGSIMVAARMAGEVDMTALEDRGRELENDTHWEAPADIIESAAQQFKYDKWLDQECYPEVWVEKVALAGILESVCDPLDVRYFATRGNPSLSEMYLAAERMDDARRRGKEPTIFYLGDHDANGLDITRDIYDRINRMTDEGWVEVRRIALNMDQIEEYNPPPSPQKESDSRSKGYVAQFGYDCWELDALKPAVLTGIIDDAVRAIRDRDLWDAQVEREEDAKADLRDVHAELVDKYEDEES